MKRNDERIARARIEPQWLRSRYDCGSVSDAVCSIVKKLECDISWLEHEQRP